jgi:hypothetical protein
MLFCKDNLVKSLTYLLDEEHHIQIDYQDILDLDRFAIRYEESGCNSYLVKIGVKFYIVNPFTKIETARAILDNFNLISYVYSVSDNFDTIVGDVKLFCIQNNVTICEYRAFVRQHNEKLTKQDIINQFNSESFVREVLL